MTSQVLYPLWPKQQEAMQLLGLGGYTTPDPVEELLYGGQAGGGKSYFLRALGVGLCLTYPNLVIPLFRRTYPELEETHIRKIQAELPPQCGSYKADRHEWHFPNKSVLEFRYCEREDDVFKYNSAEWDGLFIDEATQLSEFQIRYLRSRVRTSEAMRPGWRSILVFTANPGGVGHHYFKKAFIDAAPPKRKITAPEEDGGARRAFIPATLDDNPALSKDYRRKVQGIADPALRRALLHGDWDVFAGQVFAEFRRAHHVCEEFAIPKEWTKWIAVDYGYSKPMCCLWFARDPRDKRVFVYRELYKTDLRDVEQAHLIKSMSRGEKFSFKLADPSLWLRQSSGGSIAQVFADEGLSLSRASNNRISGWQRVHEYLAENQHPARLQIFESCVNLIRTLPSLTYDHHQVEDVDTDLEDHAPDALRYGLMGERASKKLKIVQREFRMIA